MAGLASFAGALMLYAGYIYTNAYFGYFRLNPFAVGFSTFELVMRSLRLATLPVLELMALLLLIPALPRLLTVLHIPEHHVRRIRDFGRAVARSYLAFVVVGVTLMVLWRWIQPVRWLAPLLVAGGLLLGLTLVAQPAERPRTRAPWERAGSLLVAGLFLIWVAALVAGQLGRQDAQRDASQLVRRVAVVIMSTERLDFAPPGPHYEDLGKGVHYRYRYTNLRLLLERDHRYYLLRLGWDHATDPTYVIEDDDTVRIELRPGVLPRTDR
ncbi:hypothetical protein SAMN06272735_3469 [Streptomyces sp. TLI_55]|uniref:hypothetical protein n=1 Tax=Streptomyces sp. TLI_55 TaxID=1938861 RepID=UPI000BCDAA91|nr:hypothetical protein [Streptomyces sp. TLI_55]SNX61723.1 hypothetical protein SAMN06272735_3469 [Streptomyces sp. TLI_55]